MKVSDYIMDRIKKEGVDHLFSVTGGGCMHITDSGYRKGMLVPVMHEQAGAIAAEAYSRIRGFGACTVTTGPGCTNAITGVGCAWIDSIPMLVVSGQGNAWDLVKDSGVRQIGIQEIDITRVVSPITKKAITASEHIQYELEHCIREAKKDRPGPSWIDVPLNIQKLEIEPTDIPQETTAISYITRELYSTLELLTASKRPVIVVGNGVRLSGAVNEFLDMIEILGIPVFTTWGTADILDNDDPLYCGRPGSFGQRGANISIQQCDLLIGIGTRFSIGQTSYNRKLFAPEANKVIVDIDINELRRWDDDVVKIACPAKEFITRFMAMIEDYNPRHNSWLSYCKKMLKAYPVVLPEYAVADKPNSYRFTDALSYYLTNDDIIITDVGTSFTCTFQSFRIKKGQRLFNSSGMASMGYCLPASIGAHYASGGRIISLNGDGGIMMNIQELQTISGQNLPIKIFVYENDGYLTMKHTQINNFKLLANSNPSSGLTLPNLDKIFKSYDIPTLHINNSNEIIPRIQSTLSYDKGPIACIIHMDPMQLLTPTVRSKIVDGKVIPVGIEYMQPIIEEYETYECKRDI